MNRCHKTVDDGSSRTKRSQLLTLLVSKGAIRSSAVADAFLSVPRHPFVPQVDEDVAYSDGSVPLKTSDGTDAGLVISSSSQPAVMAIMLEQADLKPGQRVLEIGTGSGYNSALIAHILGEQGEVVTVDIDEELVASARKHLDEVGFGHVRVICADGALGHGAMAPYDRIIVTVGAWDIAPAWLV